MPEETPAVLAGFIEISYSRVLPMCAPTIAFENYEGPNSLAEDVEKALVLLDKQLSVQTRQRQTHTVLLVGSFETTSVKEAAAIYLTGVIAQSIDTALNIRKALFNETELKRDLVNDIITVVGNDKSSNQFKEDNRDPWMWECLTHMFIHLAHKNTNFHPPGTILAKTAVKHDVNDHGLDLIAIYESNGAGICAGECKAYLHNPTQGIINAAAKLREVDNATRDMEIRNTISQLRPALSNDKQKLLAGAFWKQSRSYMSCVCCDASARLDWNRNRRSLRSLNIPVDCKMLVPLAITNARQVFDQIASTMRSYTALTRG